MGMPSFSLEGKVAIVTGAKGGIGKAIALAFAEAGADVVVSTRKLDGGELEVIAKEITGLGRRSLVIQADVTRKIDVQNLVERVWYEFGVIDILVNSAGKTVKSLLLELSEETWDNIIETDLKSAFLCSQAVGKKMVEQKKGNIINLASGLATKPRQYWGAYCSAKAGLVMFTKVLALELAEYNIRVNAISPGFVKTKMTEATWTNPELIKKIYSGIPIGYGAEARDIVGSALFLASDASSYITGHNLVVDGGSNLSA